MLWLAMIWGFLTRTAARVMWNSDKARIIAPAETMPIFAVVVDAVEFPVSNWDLGEKDPLASAR